MKLTMNRTACTLLAPQACPPALLWWLAGR